MNAYGVAVLVGSLIVVGAVARFDASQSTPAADCPDTTADENRNLVRRYSQVDWSQASEELLAEIAVEDPLVLPIEQRRFQDPLAVEIGADADLDALDVPHHEVHGAAALTRASADTETRKA